jgi:cytochrome c peroxidase
MYMMFAPPLHFDLKEGGWSGGQFWDGRAATLADQAGPPMLNPVEMNNASKEDVVAKVQAGPLKKMMEQVYGPNVFDDPNIAFADIRDAIAAFEKTPVFAPFSSKFDAYLAGRTTLTAEEADGLALYNGKAKCGNCHFTTSPPGTNIPPLLTDFGYDNIGLPKNPANKFYTDDPAFNPDGASFIDRGLGKVTGNPADDGKFKASTLRNVALTAPYFHNGFAANLTEAVQFYNKRDSGIFGPPEIPGTINTTDFGNLGLTDQEVAHVVAFLNTLTDGWQPAGP